MTHDTTPAQPSHAQDCRTSPRQASADSSAGPCTPATEAACLGTADRGAAALWRAVATSFYFEFRRSRTPQRVIAWAVLAAFPVALSVMLRISDQQNPVSSEVVGSVLYTLIPGVLCLLGLLLWVSPLVHVELEGRTWSYLTTRPHGKLALLLGKYGNGVLWTVTACWTAATICTIVAPLDPREVFRFWYVMLAITSAACLAYGATNAFFAALFHKRAMVATVAYMLVFEMVVANLPIVINEITVHHRLINIFWHGMNWPVRSELALSLTAEPIWWHAAILGCQTLLMLAAATITLYLREYVSGEPA